MATIEQERFDIQNLEIERRFSPEIDKICAAMAVSQGQFTSLHKSRTVEVTMKSGGKYTFEYATLDDVCAMIRKPLSDAGCWISQQPCDGWDKLRLTTTIFHASGQFVESTLTYRTQADIQQLGGIITYLRRYALCAMLCITAEEDDDGNAASGNTATTSARKPQPPCPKCGKTSSVRTDREDPNKRYCWKNVEGCGHNWQLSAEPPAADPKAGIPPEVADKLTTADKIPPKSNGKGKGKPTVIDDPDAITAAWEQLSIACDQGFPAYSKMLFRIEESPAFSAETKKMFAKAGREEIAKRKWGPAPPPHVQQDLIDHLMPNGVGQ